jgi:predicted transcriptional regulator YdeE
MPTIERHVQVLSRQFRGEDEAAGMLALAGSASRRATVRPERVRRGGTQVVGIETRTTRQREADPATAAVPVLWRRFRQEALDSRIPNRAGTVTTCAVYTDYEGEHRGGYRCVVGAEVTGADEVPAGMVAVTVPAGEYLAFAARGPMPDALVAAWERISEFFERAPVRRAWTADLEVHYPTGSAVDVLVALRADGG